MDDVGAVQPPVEAGEVGPRPQALGDGGGQGQLAHGRLRAGPEAQHVRVDLDVPVAVEGRHELGDGDTDTGAVAVERADVEGEANGVHGSGSAGSNDPTRRLGRA